MNWNRSKWKLVAKSFILSLVPILVMSSLLAYLFRYLGPYSFKTGLTNAIPLCVISSAIAIPSVKALSKFTQEFVIYESSLSDIFGVLLFNFIVLNDSIDSASVGNFIIELVLICVVSFIATIALTYLMRKIDHHIKFAPILIIVILIYAVSKEYHLPALVFILLFGLTIGNLDELEKIKWIKKLRPAALEKEVDKLQEILIEGAFIVRALFFLLFGFLIETSEVLNLDSLPLALDIVAGTFLLRFLLLKICRLPITPLMFIAPRGLITVLLFLAIPENQVIPFVNKSLIIQLVILTALAMMIGLMMNKNKEIKEA